MFSALAIAPGAVETIFTGSLRGRLYAVNANDGSKKWEFKAGCYILSAPIVDADGTVYIASTDLLGHKLQALNQDGTLKWTLRLPGHDDGSPIFVRGKATRGAASFVISAPAIASDGTLYIGDDHGRESKLFAVSYR